MNELNPAQWRKLLRYFVADEETMRPVMRTPFEQNGYVCASDTRVLIRVAKKYITDDYTTDKKTPDVADVIPPSKPLFAIGIENLRAAFVQRGINYDDLKIPCYHCDDESEVEWEFTDSDGDKHTMWAECPCCGGSGSIPNGTNHYLEIGECTISAYFMLLLYRTMVELGIDKVNVSKGNRQQFLFEIADGIDVLVMPCILANKRVKGITKIKTTKV